MPALVMIVLALVSHRARVRLIRTWFRPGPIRAEFRPQPPGPSVGPLQPVRVLLVDGLAAEIADSLPEHRRLCAQGLRLTVDVGFPSVTLPVQHVLWTGSWQAESGLAFAVEQLAAPRLPSLPALLGTNSVAVADSHREVIASFPFHRIVAPPSRGTPLTTEAFQRAALAEARSSAALVFIHALATDQAGHLHGAASLPYRAAARRGDDLLGALAAARRPDWTLLALADHGHLPLGGHGDAEETIRFIRGCLVGPGIPTGRSLKLGMPDLTATLAARLGVAKPAVCSGHALSALLEGTEPAKPPQPRLGPLRTALALAVLIVLAATLLRIFAGLTLSRRGAVIVLLPWSSALAVVLLGCFGPPSLSQAFVYPAFSPVLLSVGLTSGLFLILQLRTARWLGVSPTTALGSLLAGLLAPTAATLLLSGWPLLQPPLVPFWSGWASSLLEVAAAALTVLAVATAIDRGKDSQGAL